MTLARPLGARSTDARERLADSHQLWLATGNSRGAHLIPVAYVLDDGLVVTATGEDSRTVANLRETGRARLGLGATDDVVMVDVNLDAFVPPAEMPTGVANRYAAVSHDPRTMPGYTYIRFRPHRVQAWNGYHEFAGRTLMLNGQWLSSSVD